MVRSTMTVGCVFLAAMFCSGCGPDGPEIAPVEGRVTMDGEPLANAAIVFIPPAGRPAGGRTDSDGKYFLTYTEGRRGTMPGKNRVRITTQSDPYESDSGEMIPAQKERVPMRYNSQSELTFDVQPKTKNVANFELESGGPIAAGDEYN